MEILAIMSINLTQPLHHGANQIHMALPLLQRPPPTPHHTEPQDVQYLVQPWIQASAGHLGGPSGELQPHFPDTENITDAVYCKNHLGYNVTSLRDAPTAAGGLQGGMVLVMRDRPEVWDFDST